MGMNFSPMYQPVSTKTIKADGDLNINPYDLLATDVKCDTVEASEFVGGVGNFVDGLGVSVTTNNTSILLGNATLTKNYSVSGTYDYGDVVDLIPEFIFTPEYNISTQTFIPIDTKGNYTCTITLANTVSEIKSVEFNLIINGVSTTLWTSASNISKSTTFTCKEGDTISFVFNNTRTGTALNMRYIGAISCNQNLYLA